MIVNMWLISLDRLIYEVNCDIATYALNYDPLMRIILLSRNVNVNKQYTHTAYVTAHHKSPVKSAPGQLYFIADSDRTYLQLWIDNCFKFIRHLEVELRFFEAWHVRIRKTEKTCLEVFILYTFPVQLHLENVSFQIFWSRNKSWYFARSLRKIWTFQIH